MVFGLGRKNGLQNESDIDIEIFEGSSKYRDISMSKMDNVGSFALSGYMKEVVQCLISSRTFNLENGSKSEEIKNIGEIKYSYEVSKGSAYCLCIVAYLLKACIQEFLPVKTHAVAIKAEAMGNRIKKTIGKLISLRTNLDGYQKTFNVYNLIVGFGFEALGRFHETYKFETVFMNSFSWSAVKTSIKSRFGDSATAKNVRNDNSASQHGEAKIKVANLINHTMTSTENLFNSDEDKKNMKAYLKKRKSTKNVDDILSMLCKYFGVDNESIDESESDLMVQLHLDFWNLFQIVSFIFEGQEDIKIACDTFASQDIFKDIRV